MESQLGEEHETLPDDAHFSTPQRLMCHVDGAECEVLARIMPALELACGGAELLALSIHEATMFLPCIRCREVMAAASRLRGTRLGQRERVIFRSATGAKKNRGTLVCSPTDARPVKEAQMRAARSLARTGLIWTWHRDEQTQRRDRYRREGGFAFVRDGKVWEWKEDVMTNVRVNRVVAGCTPLGFEIRKRYARELVGNKAIRWDKRVDEAATAAREDTHLLFARFKEKMTWFHGWIQGMAALLAGEGRRDPKAIERAEARQRVVDALAGAES